MGYLIKAGVGLALFFGSIVLFNVKLQSLLDTGTCASGNVPFEIAPGYECPEGTGTDILLVSASVFTGLIGAAIFAFRGDPPWGRRRRPVGMFGVGTLAWGIFFAGTGAALILGQPYGESVNEAGEVVGRPDSQLGSTIVGITFLVMGLPALLLGIWSWVKGLGRRDERPAAVAAAAGGSGPGFSGAFQRATIAGTGGPPAPSGWEWSSAGEAGGSFDKIKQIERLQKLRESGALTDGEFQREKAKILAEP
jgi:Short C-terminal domain